MSNFKKNSDEDFENLNGLDSRQSKISDLFEDLKNTLDNSIYQKKEDEKTEMPLKTKQKKPGIENSESISELFDALNMKIPNAASSSAPSAPSKPSPSASAGPVKQQQRSDPPAGADRSEIVKKPGKYEKIEEPEKNTNTDIKSNITKVTPTPSVFDEAKREQNKLKSKSANSGGFSDTKKVPVKSKPEKETDPDDSVKEKIKKPENIKNINEEKEPEMDIEPDADTDDDTEPDAEPETDMEMDEDMGFSIQGIDDSEMDLDLLKAIGIGKETSGTDDDLESEKAISERNKKKEKIHKDKLVSQKAPLKSLYKITNKEYSDREQIDEIFTSYRKILFFEFIKLSLGAFFFLLLFYMEIAPYLKWKLPNVLNINYYNLPYIWIDLQFLLFVAALNCKSLLYGLKSMFKSNLNIYSLSVFFLIVSVIHTGLTLYMRRNNPDMVLYNSITVYSMVLISLYNVLDMNSEITSFKTVASKKPKYAVSLQDSYNNPNSAQANIPYRSSRLETDLFRDVVPQDSTVGGILKTPFISNFFSRTYKEKNSGGILKYFIYISLSVAIILFAILVLLKRGADLYVPLSSAAILLFGSIPLCSFLINIYPVYKAQKKAYAAGSAFIGGQSIDESAEASIISIYDRDIFPADQIKTSSIKVYGNNRIETVLQYLCVLFEKLNMPPADMLIASTHFDRNFDKEVKFISMDDDGICYVSNGKKLFLGNPEYISNTGLVPPFDPNHDPQFIKSAGSIMILASEEEVIAKVYIKYEITNDFHDIVKNIRKMNACLCIRTFDPNINDELLAKLGNVKNYPIKILKLKKFADIYTTPERMDSPVISKDSLKSLINAVVIAGRTKTVMKTNGLIQGVAFGLSLLLTAGCILGQFLGINSGHLILWQSFWMFFIVILLGLTPF